MIKYVDLVSEAFWGSLRVLCGHPYSSQITEYNPDEDVILISEREEHRITMDRIESKIDTMLEETKMLIARMNRINSQVTDIKENLDINEVED